MQFIRYYLITFSTTPHEPTIKIRIKRKRKAYIDVNSSLKEESLFYLKTLQSGIASKHEKTITATLIIPQ